MNIDKLLKQMTEEVIPEEHGIFLDYLKDMDDEKLMKEKFYVGDGYDFYRFWCKYLYGVEFSIPKNKVLKSLTLRFIRETRVEHPEISEKELALMTGFNQRTIYNYLHEIADEDGYDFANRKKIGFEDK